MTPKEKAKELMDKYSNFHSGYGYKYKAKQCALIAVNEMLDFRNGLYMNEGSIVHQYLLDVKQEIINQ
jgi:hypothetical protein